MENMTRSLNVSFGLTDEERTDEVQMSANINPVGHISINLYVKSADLFKKHNGEINNKLLEFQKTVIKEIERGEE